MVRFNNVDVKKELIVSSKKKRMNVEPAGLGHFLSVFVGEQFKDGRLVTKRKNLIDEAGSFYKELYTATQTKPKTLRGQKVNCLQIA